MLFPVFLLVICVVSILATNHHNNHNNHNNIHNNEVINDKKTQIASYLLADSSYQNEGKELMKDLFQQIHANQHPPRSLCRSKRLLVLHMHTESLEGLCSLMKQVTVGLSIAMHSNRTLVWGLGEQFMFQSSKEVWAGAEREDIDVGGTKITCPDGKDPLGGPFECFYEQLSSCSMYDTTADELTGLVNNPYDHSARLMMLDVRNNAPKSVSLYYPPFGLIEHIRSRYSDKSKYKAVVKSAGPQIWAASVASYAFRLKPEIVTQFTERHRKEFHSGKKVWGLHVRHGDVKSFHHVIRQKRIFTFESYFAAARDLSHEKKKSPDLLFISTDSTKADDVPKLFEDFERDVVARDADLVTSIDEEDAYASGDDDYYEYEEEDVEIVEGEENLRPVHSEWFGNRTPSKAFSVNNTERYRTEHGFVVGAADSCVDDHSRFKKNSKICSIPMQFDVPVDNSVYGGRETILKGARSMRIMRIFLEAIEDLYLLSLTDSIVAAASSHFSTLAVMLVWARTGCEHLETSYRFLDEDTAITGDSASAFLQGTNLWNSSYTGPGPERWRIHTFRFISGLPGPPHSETVGTYAGVKGKLSYDPWSPEMRMRFVNGIPQVPDKVFYRETALWRADPNGDAWPLTCIPEPDLSRVKPPKLQEAIANFINLGADHYQYLHMRECCECWKTGLKLIMKHRHLLGDFGETMLDVARGNLQTAFSQFGVYLKFASDLSKPRGNELPYSSDGTPAEPTRNMIHDRGENPAPRDKRSLKAGKYNPDGPIPAFPEIPEDGSVPKSKKQTAITSKVGQSVEARKAATKSAPPTHLPTTHATSRTSQAQTRAAPQSPPPRSDSVEDDYEEYYDEEDEEDQVLAALRTKQKASMAARIGAQIEEVEGELRHKGSSTNQQTRHHEQPKATKHSEPRATASTSTQSASSKDSADRKRDESIAAVISKIQRMEADLTAIRKQLQQLISS